MDARRELGLIRKHYRDYSRNVGETVVWYEFQPFANAPSAGSTYDDVYDEGGFGPVGRKYRPGITVPVLLITEAEDTKRAIPEGRQPVELVNLVASIDDFRRAGISEPFEYRRHLDDIFFYDGRYMSVQSYRVRGRVRDDVVVVVEGIEVYINQEFAFDTGPDPMTVHNYPWPSTLGNT